MPSEKEEVQIILLSKALIMELLGCPDNFHSLIFIFYEVFCCCYFLGDRNLLPKYLGLERPDGLIHEEQVFEIAHKRFEFVVEIFVKIIDDLV